MKKRSRVATVDLAKGLGMIFVVMFHAKLLDGLWGQFHMPLFAFVSGMFYRDINHVSAQNISKWALKKVKGLYLPFVIYNLIFLLLHNPFYHWSIYSSVHLGFLYRFDDYKNQVINILTLGGGESLPGALWYLIAMLEFTIAYAIIRYVCVRFCKKRIIAEWVLVSIVCILLMAIGFSEIDLPRLLNRAFVLLLYYHLGWMFHQYYGGYRIVEGSLKAIIVACVFLGCGMFIGVYWNNFNLLSLPFALSGICLTLNLAQKLESSDLLWLKKMILIVGKNTLFILATHVLWFKIVTFVLVIFYSLDKKYMGSYPILENVSILWKILYVLSGIFVPILLYRIKEMFCLNWKKTT